MVDPRFVKMDDANPKWAGGGGGAGPETVIRPHFSKKNHDNKKNKNAFQ